MKSKYFKTVGIVCLAALIFCAEGAADGQRENIISAATAVANYMEEYRHLPDTVQIGLDSVSTSQFLYLMSVTVRDIQSDAGDNTYPIPAISNPENPYPSIEFDDAFYKFPLSQEVYVELIASVLSYIETHIEAPDYFVFNEGQIRYCAVVHYLASILRFYDFFGFLPKSMDIKVISPKNLVPADWNTPDNNELQQHTSAVTYHVNIADKVYYRHNVIDYSTFKLAKELTDNLSFYPAMEAIYNWVNVDTWRRWGYGQTAHTPFGNASLRSAREAWSMRFSTSGAHTVKMNALFRTLGIPSYSFYLYYIPEAQWINTDVHAPFGSDPFLDDNGNMYEGFEDSPLPDKTHDFVQKIQSFINYRSAVQNHPEGFRGLFINISDITEYGVERIINAAKAGGFSAIILTVKTPYGHLYADQGVVLPEWFFDPIWIGGGGAGQLITPVQSVALDPLFSAAHADGIEVHLGFNVLSDYVTGVKQNRADPDGHPNWSQWDGQETAASITGLISPCVSEYREMIKLILEAYLGWYPVDGVVIMDLRWLNGPVYGEFKYGHNPRCDPYKTGLQWYENVITNYFQELVTTISNAEGDCTISFLSASLGKGSTRESDATIPAKHGGQDFQRLSRLADNFIINIGGYYWLTDQYYDQDQLFLYDFAKLVSDLQSQTATPLSLAFNLRDEWEYPAEFYNGLYNYFMDTGLAGFHLYSMVSGWGEWGPAFSESQLDKSQYMALIPKLQYLPDQINQVPSDQSAGCGFPPGGNLFQSFKPSVPSLGAITLRLRVGGSFPNTGYNTTVNIRPETPQGPVVGTQTVFIPGPQRTRTQLDVRFEFSPSLLLTTGATYLIEWVSPHEGGSVLTWMTSGWNSYAEGNAFGCTANPILNEDMIFMTYTPFNTRIRYILKFFDRAVWEGTIFGSGPGKSASGRLKAMRKMIKTVGSIIDAENFDGACKKLRNIYRHADGRPKPPDFVAGEDVPKLADQILSVIKGLECPQRLDVKSPLVLK